MTADGRKAAVVASDGCADGVILTASFKGISLRQAGCPVAGGMVTLTALFKGVSPTPLTELDAQEWRETAREFCCPLIRLVGLPITFCYLNSVNVLLVIIE